MAGGQGTILLEFGILSPIEEQEGRYLYKYCSPDGIYQIKLWQSFQNYFRVDVIDPNFGIKFFKARLNHLETNKRHKLAMSWNSERINVAVDGKIIDPIS